MKTIDSQVIHKMVAWIYSIMTQPPEEADRKMDPLDWKVYRFLYEMTVYQHRPATLREVVDATQFDLCLEDDMKLQWNEKDRDHCRRMWDVVQHINNSAEVEKQVCVNRYTYSLASKKESKAAIKKMVNDGGAKIARGFRLYMKGINDGQGKLLSCQGKEIPPSEARDFVEGFVDLLISAQKEKTDNERQSKQ